MTGWQAQGYFSGSNVHIWKYTGPFAVQEPEPVEEKAPAAAPPERPVPDAPSTGGMSSMRGRRAHQENRCSVVNNLYTLMPKQCGSQLAGHAAALYSVVRSQHLVVCAVFTVCCAVRRTSRRPSNGLDIYIQSSTYNSSAYHVCLSVCLSIWVGVYHCLSPILLTTLSTGTLPSPPPPPAAARRQFALQQAADSLGCNRPLSTASVTCLHLWPHSCKPSQSPVIKILSQLTPSLQPSHKALRR